MQAGDVPEIFIFTTSASYYGRRGINDNPPKGIAGGRYHDYLEISTDIKLSIGVWFCTADHKSCRSKCPNIEPNQSPVDIFLPVELFLGKKEGDIITLTKVENNIQIPMSFRLAQRKHRYDDLNFEDYLIKVLNNGILAEPEGMFTPPYPNDQQWDDYRRFLQIHNVPKLAN